MTNPTERANDPTDATPAAATPAVAATPAAAATPATPAVAATPAAGADATPIAELSFDDALAAFQRTVAELEMGGLPLERSIALYERGAALHERCAKLLAEAELKVQQLVTRAGGVLETIDVAPDAARDTE